ncbi:MAG: hypothetical protein ACI9C2_000717 [Gammaproteobacteria bacterium]|jgi:hypothetical protein
MKEAGFDKLDIVQDRASTGKYRGSLSLALVNRDRFGDEDYGAGHKLILVGLLRTLPHLVRG